MASPAGRRGPRLLTAYRGLLRAGIGQALAYRGQLSIWVLTSLFPLVLMAVWLSVVAESGPAAGWRREDFLSYYVASAALFHVTTSFLIWRWDGDLRSGELSARMLRPVDPFHHYLCLDLGQRLVTLAVLLPLVTLAALVVPGVDYDLDPLRALLVAVAVAGGFLLASVSAMAFAMVAFWTTQAGNAYALWWGAGAFVSGWVAPVDLFPDAVRNVALLLPFRSSVGFPLEMLMGRLDGRETATGFAVTAGWLAVTTAVYRLLWHRGLRRYQAVGG